MKEKVLNKKFVYKKVLNIGLPVAIENMIYALMNFVDMFMVGKEIVALGLGTAAVAGLGFANQMFMIFMTSLFGRIVAVEFWQLSILGIRIIKI